MDSSQLLLSLHPETDAVPPAPAAPVQEQYPRSLSSRHFPSHGLKNSRTHPEWGHCGEPALRVSLFLCMRKQPVLNNLLKIPGELNVAEKSIAGYCKDIIEHGTKVRPSSRAFWPNYVANM